MPVGWLLILFVVVPAVELALLIEIGSRLGTGTTLALILLTGVVGASLARRQGLGVLGEIRRQTDAGQLPAGALVDGVILLIAGALLVTPGVLTDVCGFLCLVPAFRVQLKKEFVRHLQRAAREGRLHVQVHGYEADPWGPREEREVRDVDDVREVREVRDVDDDRRLH